MRIWDIPCSKLCNKHLLGEHRELHCIWTFITTDKGGSYKKHPETLRWVGKLDALFWRHYEQKKEFEKRGFDHKSELPKDVVGDQGFQDKQWQTLSEQIEILKNKRCDCRLNEIKI